MDSKKIGIFIAERRKDLGLTQQQLADKICVSNKTVSKWETGEGYPDITVILDLSKAICVTADELLNAEMKQSFNVRNQTENNEPYPKNNCYSENSHSLLVKQKEKKYNKKTSLWSPMCVLSGVLLSVFLFSLEIDSGMGFINVIPMYIVAITLIIGGITNKLMYGYKN